MSRTPCGALAALLLVGGLVLARDDAGIVSPAPGATIGPEARFVFDAPPGAKTTIFQMDQVELARFSGPGRHTLDRRLSRPGRRQFNVKVYDEAGRLVRHARVDVVVRGGDLVPPTARGPIRPHRGRKGVVRLNERTAVMLANARRWLEAHGGCPPGRAAPAWLLQGSYSGSVGASAGTHDGGGAIDLSVAGLSPAARERLVRALREAGFAAWLRRTPTFSIDHVHAIAVGDPDLPPAARSQVRDYFQGRDGLKGRRRDPHGGPVVKAWMRPFLQRDGLSAALGRLGA